MVQRAASHRGQTAQTIRDPAYFRFRHVELRHAGPARRRARGEFTPDDRKTLWENTSGRGTKRASRRYAQVQPQVQPISLFRLTT
jgi:hypothetical protein